MCRPGVLPRKLGGAGAMLDKQRTDQEADRSIAFLSSVTNRGNGGQHPKPGVCHPRARNRGPRNSAGPSRRPDACSASKAQLEAGGADRPDREARVVVNLPTVKALCAEPSGRRQRAAAGEKRRATVEQVGGRGRPGANDCEGYHDKILCRPAAAQLTSTFYGAARFGLPGWRVAV